MSTMMTFAGCDHKDEEAAPPQSAGMRPAEGDSRVVQGIDRYYGEVRVFVQSSRDGRPLRGAHVTVELLNGGEVLSSGSGYTDDMGFERYAVSAVRAYDVPYDRVRVIAAASGFQTSTEIRLIHWRLIGPQPAGGVERRFDAEFYLNLASW
jgi:hypothetical protein